MRMREEEENSLRAFLPKQPSLPSQICFWVLEGRGKEEAQGVYNCKEVVDLVQLLQASGNSFGTFFCSNLYFSLES